MEAQMKKNLDDILKGAVAALGFIGGGTALYDCAHSVKQGEKGIVTTFGKVERLVEPGLAFHWPWQDVTKMNIQSQTADIPLEVYSKDSQLAPQNVLSVTFSLPADKVLEVYSKYGPTYFETVLKNPVENIFRECFGRMTADQIIAEREKLNADVSQRLKEEFASRSIKFERVSISIKFNEAFNRSAEESAIARTKVNTEKQNLERKEIEAEQKIIEAKADADALLAKKEAEAKGIATVGAADVKVIELKSAALQKNPDYPRMIVAENWDGKLPTTLVPGQTIPFIELTPPARP
jgi:regulator of protease activity HflC (stomatin/prohibitin superfamily)